MKKTRVFHPTLHVFYDVHDAGPWTEAGWLLRASKPKPSSEGKAK